MGRSWGRGKELGGGQESIWGGLGLPVVQRKTKIVLCEMRKMVNNCIGVKMIRIMKPERCVEDR